MHNYWHKLIMLQSIMDKAPSDRRLLKNQTGLDPSLRSKGI